MDIIPALAGVFVADRADFFEDGIFFHGSIDISSAGVAITGQTIPS